MTPASSTVIREDGSFRLVVLPGPGAVCVAASPKNAYAVAAVNEKEWANLVDDESNRGDVQRPHSAVGRGEWILCVNKYNAVSLINPREKADGQVLDLRIQKTPALPGTVVDLAGKLLAGVKVAGLTPMPDEEILASGSFTVLGLHPRRSRELLFQHRGKALGKFLRIRGDESNPLTVHLEPCGSLTGRFLDQAGKPVPGIDVYCGRGGDMPSPDLVILPVSAQTDSEGRFRMALVSGPTYWLRATKPLKGEPELRNAMKQFNGTGREVEVKSGRITDLGEIVLGN
jgi:hypothetical protein